MRFNDTLTEIVKQTLETNRIPALMGEPGIGKSSFVKALAYSMGTKSFTLACNLLADKADLTGGRLVPTEDGTSYRQVFYPHETIQEAIEYAVANPREWPILFLDEVNRTTSDVTSAALGVSTDRTIGRTPLPDNLRLMVAGNNKGNVTALDEASLSRFVIFNVEPDASTLVEILGDDMNHWVKKVLVQFPALVFQKSTPSVTAIDGDADPDDDDDDNLAAFADLFEAGEEMLQLTTPRTIENLSHWLNKAERDDLGRYLATPAVVGGREVTVLNEIVEAFVGNTAFATQVISAIAEDLASGNGGTTSNRVNVPKPNCYADLKGAATVTELNEVIARLTSNEKSGSLLYALKESTDNSRLIEQLAHSIDQIEAEHTRTLFEMVSAQQADTQNVESFLNSAAPVADAVRPMLSAFL